MGGSGRDLLTDEMRKKIKKYYLVQNENGRYYGAFPLGERGKLEAQAYAKVLKKRHKENFNVVEA